MRGCSRASIFGRWGKPVNADRLQQSEDLQPLNTTTAYLDSGIERLSAISGFEDPVMVLQYWCLCRLWSSTLNGRARNHSPNIAFRLSDDDPPNQVY